LTNQYRGFKHKNTTSVQKKQKSAQKERSWILNKPHKVKSRSYIIWIPIINQNQKPFWLPSKPIKVKSNLNLMVSVIFMTGQKKKSKLRTFEKRVSNFHSNPDSKNRQGFKTKTFPFQISNQLKKPKSRWKIIKFEGKKRNLLPGWPYNKINKLLHSISLLLVSLLWLL